MDLGPSTIEHSNARPGMEGEEYDQMVAKQQAQILAEEATNHVPGVERTISELRQHGVDDPYGTIEQE